MVNVQTVSGVVNLYRRHFRDLLVLREPLYAGLEGLRVVVLHPCVAAVFHAIFFEEVHVVHLCAEVLSCLLDVLELFLPVFVLVVVDFPDSRLVDGWGRLFACELDVLLETGALEALLTIDKLHQIGECLFRLQKTVFVADDVDGNA